MHSILLDLQISDRIIADTSFKEIDAIPSESDFLSWITSSLHFHAQSQANEKEHQRDTKKSSKEISIRIVDEQESAEFNFQYRKRDTATNVLSFPADIPDYVGTVLLGDLLICLPVVIKEANEQKKNIAQHWAHMVIHGTLHLLGYDHINEHDAKIMEPLEVDILASLQFPNPYHDDSNA